LLAAEASSYFFDFSGLIDRRDQNRIYEALLTQQQFDLITSALRREKLIFERAWYDELEEKASAQGLDLLQKYATPGANGYHSIVRTNQEGRLIYDVQIGLDQYSRRVVPGFRKEAKRAVVFLGDSFVFGEGLNDEQTMPARFQKLNPDLSVYNLGVPGAGPNDFLHKLRQPEDPFFSGVDAKEGVVFYVFQDFHDQRANCNLSNFYDGKEYRLDKPLYSLSGENLTYLGDCRRVRRGNRLFTLLSHSNFVRANRLDWPLPSSSYPKRLVAKILAEVKEESLRLFHAKRFVVVLYPSQRRSRDFLPYFQAAGLKVLDFSHFDIKKATQRSHKIPGDQHPSAAAALVFAHLIQWSQMAR
jgi:hypothetical protein